MSESGNYFGLLRCLFHAEDHAYIPEIKLQPQSRRAEPQAEYPPMGLRSTETKGAYEGPLAVGKVLFKLLGFSPFTSPWKVAYPVPQKAFRILKALSCHFPNYNPKPYLDPGWGSILLFLHGISRISGRTSRVQASPTP